MFYVEPVLAQWFRNEESNYLDYLDRACKAGRLSLAKLQKHTKTEQLSLRLCEALFRNRDRGHDAISRRFDSLIDFFDDSDSSLITPGLDAPNCESLSSKLTLRQKSKHLLGEAFKECANERNSPISPFDVINWYEETLKSQVAGGGDLDLRIGELHGLLSNAFTVGGHRTGRWDANAAFDATSSAILFGQSKLSDDVQRWRGSQEKRSFFSHLLRSFQRLSPEQFDRWLANARSHSFLSLVGAISLGGEERNQAAINARSIFRTIMWEVWLNMGRCYGALMLHACVDFSLHNEEGKPTDEEIWRFKQLNFPHLCLAALPLAFFRRGPMLWMWGTFHDLWRNLELDGSLYDSCTNMLAMYGLLVKLRRKADVASKNKRKTKQGKAAEEAESSLNTVDEADKQMLVKNKNLPVLRSTKCDVCGHVLKPGEAIDDSDTMNPIIIMACTNCEWERPYRVDVESLQSKSAAR